MAFSTYQDPIEVQPVGEKTINTSKTLAKCFGYMGIGLLISAVVAFGIGALFANLIFAGYEFNGEFTDSNIVAANAYIAIMAVSFIALMIDSFAMNAVFIRGKHSIWPAYIIYASLMGVFLSSFLLLGIDFATIGTAALVSAAVFGILFAVGYFSKRNLGFLAYIGISIVSVIGLFGLFGLVLFLILPGAALVYSLVYTLALAILLLIVIAWDAWSVRKTIERGAVNDNMALYLAFHMYCDFVALFVRILYYIVVSASDNR